MTWAVRLSEQTIDDLIGIQSWIAEGADLSVADRYIARLTKKFVMLADFPRAGSPREELAPGLRSLAFEGRLSIIYRIVGDDVWIERIVSTARDVDSLF